MYYGVLAAHAAWRPQLPRPGERIALALDAGEAPGGGAEHSPASEDASSPTSARPPTRTGSNWLWAQLMRRSFGFDVLACPRCGDRFRLVALIEQQSVIERILRHLGLPTDVPAARPSRAPPASVDHKRFDDDAA